MLVTLQICGFVPIPAGPAALPEVLFAGGTFVGGAVLFGTAYLISVLQLAADTD